MHDVFGLIGYPLGHSFSRRYWTERFAREGRDAEYRNFEIADAQHLLDVVRLNPTLRGLNCTIPHKTAIIPLLDELSPNAREIGAVNVVRIRRDASPRGFRLTGYNSDIIGFTDSLRPLLRPHHRRALVLGTGGASRAVCVGLTRLGLEWTYVSRTPAAGRLTYADLTPEVMDAHTVIVNCTPVGMYPHTDACPDIPYACLTPRHILFDLVYNPALTLFLQRGRERGAVVKNGQEMLERQAEASWEMWNGRQCP